MSKFKLEKVAKAKHLSCVLFSQKDHNFGLSACGEVKYALYENDKFIGHLCRFHGREWMEQE